MSLVSHELKLPITSGGKDKEVIIKRKGTSVLTEKLNNRLQVLIDNGTLAVVNVRSSKPIEVSESIKRKRSSKKEDTPVEKTEETPADSKEDTKDDKGKKKSGKGKS